MLVLVQEVVAPGSVHLALALDLVLVPGLIKNRHKKAPVRVLVSSQFYPLHW